MHGHTGLLCAVRDGYVVFAAGTQNTNAVVEVLITEDTLEQVVN